MWELHTLGGYVLLLVLIAQLTFPEIPLAINIVTDILSAYRGWSVGLGV